MTKPVISVYEQSVLRLGEKKKSVTFTENYLSQLARVKRELPAGMYRLEYQSIRLGNLVGLVELPDVIIEVLPKINRSGNVIHTRTRWTQLLQKFEFLPQLGNLNPQLLMQPGNLSETLQRIFLDEVHQLTRRGLKREYGSQEGQMPFMRGKLLLSEQIRTNLVHKHRFYVQSRSLQEDHYANQRIKQALRVVNHWGGYQTRAKDLLRYFQRVTNLPLNTSEKNISFNRNTQHYQTPLRLANLICGGYLGGTFAGNDFGFSLLFDMSRVFELLIYYHLQKLSKNYRFTLHYQSQRAFWKSKNLRPDFLLDFGSNHRLVIDTKWKVLEVAEPADEDLRQVFTYTQLFNAKRGILLYPKVGNLLPVVRQFNSNEANTSTGEVQFVSLESSLTDQLKKLFPAAKS
ncbi:MAG: McrC family protein [Cyclobacteriaceae bacterium]